MSFKPNSTWRPGFDDVMSPKSGPALVFGAPRIGVFVTFRNCVMNWKLVRSDIANAFMMLRSEVASPGPRNEPAAQVPK